MTLNEHSREYDYILVGGGLQSGLLALALMHHRPDASVLLIERDSRLGGNHTWSFHPGDVPPSSREWIDPVIEHRWPQYQVRIHGRNRRVGLAYASISSERFAEVVSGLFESESESLIVGDSPSRERNSREFKLGQRHDGFAGSTAMLQSTSTAEPSHEKKNTSDWRLRTNTEVINISEDSLLTSCGKVFRGRLVVDCRGPSAKRQVFAGCGYQKFFGLEIGLSEDWPCDQPVIMDALADQKDGFRFLYTLPFSPRRVLVEDTRFSDSPTIHRDECLAKVTSYLRQNGITDFEILREESGVLPMPFSSELRPGATRPLAGGYAGGWFHAATGYSFPMAVAFAEAVATTSPDLATKAVRALADEHSWQSKYARFLNRLLFRLVAPRQRYRIFRRFYHVLSDRAIERFYSHRFTVGDAVRIVVGIPPTILGLRPLRFVRSFFRGDVQ